MAKRESGTLTLADMSPEKGVAVDAMKPADNAVREIKRTEYMAKDGSPIIREDIY